jgi:hypothetical protein
MEEKEEEALGLKERGDDVAQRSHESSLPVSRITVAFWGGVPTERETVKLTLWWNLSLFGALGKEEGGMDWVFRGKMRGLECEWEWEWEWERWLGLIERETVDWKRRMARMRRGALAVAAMIV